MAPRKPVVYAFLLILIAVAAIVAAVWAVYGRDLRWAALEYFSTNTPQKRCFQSGYLVDFEEGLGDCLVSARAGNINSQYHLAELYYLGQGVQRDYHRAFDWYMRAAMQGHTEAQHNVAHMYHQGEGVSRDPVRALAWYEIFAFFHDGGAGYYPAREDLRLTLSAGQVAEAEAIFREISARIRARTGWD